MKRPFYPLGRQRSGTAAPAHLPPPVGGLNARDPLPAMPPSDAVELINFFPTSTELQLRGGSAAYTTGALPLLVRSLMTYRAAGGAAKLFAATADGIYDASAGGDLSAAVAAVDLDDGEARAVNFQNTVGTSYLWVTCPSRPVALFDGAAWTLLHATSTPALTGVAPESLRAPWVFKRRIFAIQAGSMNAWHLEVDEIAGAMSQIPLGPLFSRGGELLAGGTWSLDGGSGLDDYCVFVTSEGEVAVYQGSNPEDAADWGLVGVYYVGRPLGSRCLFKLGGDLGIMTITGLYPLSKVLRGEEVAMSAALTRKIERTWVQYAKAFGANAGWDVVVLPEREALIVNVPLQVDQTYRQLVMNLSTGAWTKFDGWNASALVRHNQTLYFGAPSGHLYRAWQEDLLNDSGTAIEGVAQTSFGYFGTRPGLKTIPLLRPHLRYDGETLVEWGLATDYRPGAVSASLTVDSSALDWDVAPWDTSSWGDASVYERQWRCAEAPPAHAHSLILEVTTAEAKVAWTGTDFVVQRGGIL